MNELAVLSAGAALGLLRTLKPDLEAREDCTITVEFGPVVAVKERLLAGAPCDILISSQAELRALSDSSWVSPTSIRPVGSVGTAMAVVDGGKKPLLRDAASVAAALEAASGIYLPDMKRATAGIHMRKVFAQLKIIDVIKRRLHEFENGAAAMRALADSADPFSLGCTQASEILYTEGVELVGLLPDGVGLRTRYDVGITTQTVREGLARHVVAYIAGAAAQEARRAAGF